MSATNVNTSSAATDTGNHVNHSDSTVANYAVGQLYYTTESTNAKNIDECIEKFEKCQEQIKQLYVDLNKGKKKMRQLRRHANSSSSSIGTRVYNHYHPYQSGLDAVLSKIHDAMDELEQLREP